MSNYPKLTYCFVLALTVALTGCGGSEPPEFAARLVPVTGTVTLDGEPLADAVIHFDPQQGDGESAVGKTDANGKYELKTLLGGQEPELGAVPGSYRVVISRIEMPDGSAIPPDMSDADAEAEGAKEVIPATYSDWGETTLRAEVPDGGNNALDFKL